MNLPDSFTFSVAGTEYQMTLDGNIYRCGNVGSTDPQGVWDYQDICNNLKHGAWKMGKDLTKPLCAFPDTFQFTHENTTQLYNMTRLAGTAQPLWACTRGDEEGYSASPLYNETQIQYNFDNGYWQEISSSEPSEPEMVFPFNFTVPGYEETNGEYTMYKDQAGVSWVKCADWEATQPDLYSKEEMRRFIKEGKWRVTSVGEQPPKEEIFDANKKENFKESTRLSFGKLEDLTVTLKADTTDAVVDMQNATLVAINLAQAVENVTMALESLNSILADMGLALVPKSVSEDCHAFCCEEG